MPVYKNRTIVLKMPTIVLSLTCVVLLFFSLFSHLFQMANETARLARVRCQYLFGDNSVLTMLTKQPVAGTSQQHAEQHADSDMT